MSNIELDKNVADGYKLLFDTFKHLTTLSTSTIIVLCAFLKNVFAAPEWEILISVILVAFLVSTVGSVAAMLFYAEILRTNEKIEDFVQKGGQCGFWISSLCFLIGVLLLVVFSIKNLT